MVFLKILKKILGILSSDKYEIKTNFKLSFFKGAKLIEINKFSKTINVDLSQADPTQISRLGRVYPDLIDSEVIILKKNDYQTCKEFIEESKETPTLKFFKGKINEEDFEALRTAVFIKNKRDKGEDINKYLEQLRKKFGSRGNNICNLYGEGYFESILKPLYSILKARNNEDDFESQFDEFVMTLPISYFVSYGKSQEMINKELKNKIKKSKQYGIKTINVHGIGKENKEKIIEFEKSISEDYTLKISSLKDDEERKSIKINLKRKPKN